MKDIISALEWRYATKKFDSDKKLSEKQISDIETMLKLTPSSFGLQPWKFVIVSDQDTKNALLEHSWNQAQVTDASHVIVLCRVWKLDDSLVDDYINDMIEKTWASPEDLAWYEWMMKWFLKNMDQSWLETWADKQIYVALGNIMTCLAMMEIDACPMEWFINEKYDEILKLDDKDLSSVLVLPVWYRHSDDDYAKRPKIRYSEEHLFSEI